MANNPGDPVLQDGVEILLKETTTPTAVSGSMKVYTKTDNKLYVQDGAGVEHEVSEADLLHGEFFVNGNGTATVITDASKPVALEIGASDHLKDFTFQGGSNGVITNTADNSTVLRITDASHGLVTGDIVTINGLATASQNAMTKITRIDDNTFDCDDITFATASETGTWQMGSYLLVPAGGAGDYRVMFTATATAASANKTYTAQLVVGITLDDPMISEVRLASTDVSMMGFGGIHTLAVADRVWICLNGLTDGTNITLKHFNLSLNRI